MACGELCVEPALAFTAAGTSVCLDFPGGINHTNRGPLDSLGEPSPLELNTCPILQAVQSALRPRRSSEARSLQNSFLEGTFFVATVQPFRLNRQRENSALRAEGVPPVRQEGRNCLGFVTSAVGTPVPC